MGELLFIGSCAGNFYAINKTTGQLQWSYDIRRDGNQVSFHGNPLAIEDLILIGSDMSCDPSGVGHAYAFERESGKVRWKYRSTSVPTDIVQLNSNVYFGSFQDNWSSVDLHTGRLEWSFSTGASNPDCRLPRAPAIYKNRVIVSALDGIIYSLDASSGSVVWKRKIAATASTALFLKDDHIYVGTEDQRLYRFNAETGAVISNLALDAKPMGGMAFANDSLLMFLENAPERVGYIISVDLKLSGLRWKRKASPEWASERPHIWNDSVVTGNCRGEMAAFRITDGEPQWSVNLTGCIRSIGSSGNMLFAGVQEGIVYAYELRSKR